MNNKSPKHLDIQKQINSKLNNLDTKKEKTSKPKSMIKSTNLSIFSKSVKPFKIN
ncbi:MULTISPECIES: hypothetical protein [Priestia]|uniref:hypothetical protein n=1 Tax=Priestia TaxID=2800373 RepID=UPI00081598C3|nr:MULTISPECIES: hypothetical protein [Priestia]SCC26216.1 hypothetical protein GA0061087_102243 [Priestia flexa]